jgi:hypothetical protein
MPVNPRQTVATIDSPPERSPHFRRVRVAISSRFDVEVGRVARNGRSRLVMGRLACRNGSWGEWGFGGQVR